MSGFVLDGSLALQQLLRDETERKWNLAVLTSLPEKGAAVPLLRFYEVGSGLIGAYRRKRITLGHIEGFLTRLKVLQIEAQIGHPRKPSNCLP